MLRLLVLACTALIAASTVSAQALSDFEQSRSSTASYFNYAEPADQTVLVNVWGTVSSPGLYEIPVQTSLTHLLSLTGGPIVGQRNRRQDRTIQVRVFRLQSGERALVYETEMQNEVIAASNDLMLQDADVVTVETVGRQRFSWRDVFPIVSAVGTIAIVIERIVLQ